MVYRMEESQAPSAHKSWLSMPCPQCEEIVEVEGDWSGQIISCPACSTSISLPGEFEKNLTLRICPTCETEIHYLGQDPYPLLSCPACRAQIPNAPKKSKLTSVPPPPSSVLLPPVPAKENTTLAEPPPDINKVHPPEALLASPPARSIEPDAKKEEEELEQKVDAAVDHVLSPFYKIAAWPFNFAFQLSQSILKWLQRSLRKTSVAIARLYRPRKKRSISPPAPPAVELKPEEPVTPQTAHTNLPSPPIIPPPPPLSNKEEEKEIKKPFPTESAPPFPPPPAPPALSLNRSRRLRVKMRRCYRTIHERFKRTVKPLAYTAIGLLLTTGIVFWSISAYQHHQLKKEGFTRWDDYQLHRQLQQLLQDRKTISVLELLEKRFASPPVPDESLHRLLIELRAALGQQFLSINDIPALIKDNQVGIETICRALAWEGAWKGSSNIRMRCVEVLFKLMDQGKNELPREALSKCLDRSPEKILGPRPESLLGYYWDQTAGKWYFLKWQFGDSDAAESLKNWLKDPQNRIRRETATKFLLKGGQEDVQDTASVLFKSLTDAIAFRVKVSAEFRQSNPTRDPEDVNRQIKRWATEDLAQSAAEMYGLLYQKGIADGLSLFMNALRTDALYGELAVASAREMTRLMDAEALPYLKTAQSYWIDYQTKLKTEANGVPSEENRTFQSIAENALNGIQIELARAGDHAVRSKLSEQLRQGNDYQRVHLAIEWGQKGLDLAMPSLSTIARRESGELIFSEDESRKAVEIILEHGTGETRDILVRHLPHPDRDIRCQAALRLLELSLTQHSNR